MTGTPPTWNGNLLNGSLAVANDSVIRRGVVVALFLGIFGGLYYAIFVDLTLQWWEDPNYSHGFLIPLVSGYLIWQRRSVLENVTSQGTWLGLAVLLAGIGMLVLGEIGAENFLMRISAIVILSGLIALHFGLEPLRILSFPLAYLIFMVPLPAILFYAIAFPLQNIAARNAAWMLDLIGVPALLEGNVIHLSQLSLGVTEACSGIRSLISLLALTTAWAYFKLNRRLLQVLLIIAAVPIAILANAARVVATGLIGQLFGVNYAEGFFHLLSGWLLFLVAFLGLLGVYGLMPTGKAITSRVKE